MVAAGVDDETVAVAGMRAGPRVGGLPVGDHLWVDASGPVGSALTVACGPDAAFVVALGNGAFVGLAID